MFLIVVDTHVDVVGEAEGQETPQQFLISPEVTDSPQCVASAAPSRVFKVCGYSTFVKFNCSTVCSFVQLGCFPW